MLGLSPRIIYQLLAQQFPPLSTTIDDLLYQHFTLRMRQLSNITDQLKCIPVLQAEVALCLLSHDMLPTYQTLTTAFHNMRCLQDELIKTITSTDATFWEILDGFPDYTEIQLKCVINRVRRRSSMFLNI